jgi:hypothetical protein
VNSGDVIVGADMISQKSARLLFAIGRPEHRDDAYLFATKDGSMPLGLHRVPQLPACDFAMVGSALETIDPDNGWRALYQGASVIPRLTRHNRSATGSGSVASAFHHENSSPTW